jgi:hypothetical protein
MVGVVLLVVEARGDERKSPVGSAAERKRYSLVVWLPASIIRYWPSRVRPTPRLKRASSSKRTRASSSRARRGCGGRCGRGAWWSRLRWSRRGCGSRRPRRGADALGGVGQVGPGAQGWIITANVERVLAEAGGIGGVGEQVAVGADGHAADGHEGVSLGEEVDVEDDLLGLGGVEGRIEFCRAKGVWSAARRQRMGYWLPSTVRVV